MLYKKLLIAYVLVCTSVAFAQDERKFESFGFSPFPGLAPLPDVDGLLNKFEFRQASMQLVERRMRNLAFLKFGAVCADKKFDNSIYRSLSQGVYRERANKLLKDAEFENYALYTADIFLVGNKQILQDMVNVPVNSTTKSSLAALLMQPISIDQINSKVLDNLSEDLAKSICTKP
jgi:hypothetical protein